MVNITVLIPYYNDLNTIKSTIESVISQTLQPKEIIIVDDGSKESQRIGLIELIGHYEVKINIIHQQNQGVSAARNNGVKYAVGDYIAFLDADDVWYEEYLEYASEAIERYSVDVFVGKVVKVFANNKKITYGPKKSIILTGIKAVEQVLKSKNVTSLVQN